MWSASLISLLSSHKEALQSLIQKPFYCVVCLRNVLRATLPPVPPPCLLPPCPLPGVMCRGTLSMPALISHPYVFTEHLTLQTRAHHPSRRYIYTHVPPLSPSADRLFLHIDVTDSHICLTDTLMSSKKHLSSYVLHAHRRSRCTWMEDLNWFFLPRAIIWKGRRVMHIWGH